jgi:hypothetical protein
MTDMGDLHDSRTYLIDLKHRVGNFGAPDRSYQAELAIVATVNDIQVSA